MTNEQLKQQAIQEAYCKEFILTGNTREDAENRFKAIWWAVGKAGWFCGNLHEVTKANFEYNGEYCRPIRLRGIENNNGWVRISEDGSNLPTEGRFCSGKLTELGVWWEMTDTMLKEEIETYFTACQITHYRPVVEHPKPVY